MNEQKYGKRPQGEGMRRATRGGARPNGRMMGQAFDFIGEPGWYRTIDLLIKSQSLYP
jgi:hypothetical protein